MGYAHVRSHVGGVHAHVVDKYLCMIEFSERAIVKTAKVQQKAQEANVDLSKGDSKRSTSRLAP